MTKNIKVTINRSQGLVQQKCESTETCSFDISGVGLNLNNGDLAINNGNIVGNVTGNLSGTFTGITIYGLKTTTSTTAIIPSTQTYTFIDASTGGVSVTFPSATGLDGQLFIVKKIDSSGNQITLSGSTTAQLFDGEVTAVINIPMTALSFIASGSNWWLV